MMHKCAFPASEIGTKLKIAVGQLFTCSGSWGLSGKESTWQWRRRGSIPGSRRSSGEGNVNPLQYSCLGNPMDREGW